MNKKTQMFIGVAAVGVVAYLLWQKSQKPKSFMNLVARKSGGGGVVGVDTRECAGPVEVATYQSGGMATDCHWSCVSKKTGDAINLGPAPCPTPASF